MSRFAQFWRSFLFALSLSTQTLLVTGRGLLVHAAAPGDPVPPRFVPFLQTNSGRWSFEQQIEFQRRQAEENVYVRRISTTLCEHTNKVLDVFANDGCMHGFPPVGVGLGFTQIFFAQRDHWFQRLDQSRELLRRDLGELLRLVIWEQQEVVVDFFGSVVTGLGTPESDVDVSVRLKANLSVTELSKRLKRLFHQSLLDRGVTVVPVAGAAVPLIKVAIPRRIIGGEVHDSSSKMEQDFFRFDISINNLAGIRNSAWLRKQVESIPHSRLYFRSLMLRLKEFARRNNLDKTSRSDHDHHAAHQKPFRYGVSSYGWALLVSFYLHQKSAVGGPGKRVDLLLRDFKAYYYHFNWERDIISFPFSGQEILDHTQTPLHPQEKTPLSSSVGEPLVLLDPFVPNRNLLKYFLRNFSSARRRDHDTITQEALQTWRAVFAPDMAPRTLALFDMVPLVSSCSSSAPRCTSTHTQRGPPHTQHERPLPRVGSGTYRPCAPPGKEPPLELQRPPVEVVVPATRTPSDHGTDVSTYTTDWQIPFSELLGGETLEKMPIRHQGRKMPSMWSSEAFIKGRKEFS